MPEKYPPPPEEIDGQSDLSSDLVSNIPESHLPIEVVAPVESNSSIPSLYNTQTTLADLEQGPLMAPLSVEARSTSGNILDLAPSISDNNQELAAVVSTLHHQSTGTLANWLGKHELVDPEKQWPGFDARSQTEALMNLSGFERQRALDALNRNFVIHINNVANLYRELEEAITKDRSVENYQLLDFAFSEASRLGLNAAETRDLERAVCDFIGRRDYVGRLRRMYPDDQVLFRHLFEVEPNGPVQIEDRVTCLNVICSDDQDFARLRASGGMPIDASKEVGLDAAGRSIGFASLKRSYITVERGSAGVSRHEAKVIDHEQQHLKYNTRTGREFYVTSPDEARIQKSVDYYTDKLQQLEVDSSDRRELVLKLLRSYRWFCMDRLVKDEILAYITNENIASNAIIDTLTESAQSKGLYDYYRGGESDWYKLLMDEVSDELKADQVMQQQLAEASHQVFVQEYQALIKTSLEVIVNLKDLGFSVDQIISLLTNVPLDRWVALETRMVRELMGVNREWAAQMVQHHRT